MFQLHQCPNVLQNLVCFLFSFFIATDLNFLMIKYKIMASSILQNRLLLKCHMSALQNLYSILLVSNTSSYHYQSWSDVTSSPALSLFQIPRHKCADDQTTTDHDWTEVDSLHVSRSQRTAAVFDTDHYTATSAPDSCPPHHGMYDIPMTASRNSAVF